MVDVGILGDEAVLTGGMAMRCYRSTRFSVYDSDTSSIPVVTDEQLLRALNYEEANTKVSREHKKRVEALTLEVRRDRLWNPEKYLSSEHPFNKLAFFTPAPPVADKMKLGVQRWIVPVLFN